MLASALAPNTHVLDGQFRIVSPLGAGGMGDVYLAEQLGMGRFVVIKLLQAHLIEQCPSFVERFEREARVVAQLNHPHVVQVHACGRTPFGVPYMALEFVQGETLSELLEREGRLPVERALPIFDQVCSALEEAHARGIVHRDLKPDNIMLIDQRGTRDYVKLLDFGIAKVPDEGDAKLTQSGVVLGTPQYMAPEQARGSLTDARTDIYALGLILFEMLTGRAAFAGNNVYEVISNQLLHMPPSLDELGVAAQALDATLRRCIAKDPRGRWPGVHALREALGSQQIQRSGVQLAPGIADAPAPHTIQGKQLRRSQRRRARALRERQRDAVLNYSDEEYEYASQSGYHAFGAYLVKRWKLPVWTRPYAGGVVYLACIGSLISFSAFSRACG